MITKYKAKYLIPGFENKIKIYSINNGKEYYIDNGNIESYNLEGNPKLINNKLLQTLINGFFNDYFEKISDEYNIFDVEKIFNKSELKALENEVYKIIKNMFIRGGNVYTKDEIKYLFLVDINRISSKDKNILKIIKNTKLNGDFSLVLKYILYSFITKGYIKDTTKNNYNSISDYLINTNNEYILVKF